MSDSNWAAQLRSLVSDRRASGTTWVEQRRQLKASKRATEFQLYLYARCQSVRAEASRMAGSPPKGGLLLSSWEIQMFFGGDVGAVERELNGMLERLKAASPADYQNILGSYGVPVPEGKSISRADIDETDRARRRLVTLNEWDPGDLDSEDFMAYAKSIAAAMKDILSCPLLT